MKRIKNKDKVTIIILSTFVNIIKRKMNFFHSYIVAYSRNFLVHEFLLNEQTFAVYPQHFNQLSDCIGNRLNPME